MIDLGEAMVAKIGAQPFIYKTFEKIDRSQWREIRDIDGEVKTLAKQLCAEELKPPKSRTVNYDRMLEQLPIDPKAGEFAAIVDAFKNEQLDLATMLQGQVLRTYNFLRTCFPIQTVKSAVGWENVQPADALIMAFEDTWSLIDEPLSLFNWIAEDSLTSGLAVDVMKCYPSLYSSAVSAIVAAIQNAKASDKEFSPTWERSFASLIGVPGLDPALTQALGVPLPDNGKPPPRQAQQSSKQPQIATPSQVTEQEQHP